MTPSQPDRPGDDASGRVVGGISPFARIRDGDEAAYDALFRAEYALLVRAAQWIVRDQAAAEDLVQDVLLAVWRSRATLPVDGSPRGYLLRAVRNRALNVVRHARVVASAAQELAASESVEPEAPATLVATELQAAISEVVAGLPERCRLIFEMSRRDGLSHAEIAEALEITPKTVENQVGKALKVLRVALAPWLPESTDE